MTFSVDLIAPRTKSGKTAAPKDKVRVQGSKTLMHTTISLQDIDLRAESALKKRVSTVSCAWCLALVVMSDTERGAECVPTQKN